MKKKILTCIIAGIMAVVTTLGLAGCTEDYLPEYESEYFRYAVRTNKDGTKEGYLIGFTELGAEQTHLILPQELDGIPIVDLGYERQLGWGMERVGEFYNSELKKLFVPFEPLKNTWSQKDIHRHFVSLEIEVIQWRSNKIKISGKKLIYGYSLYGSLVENGTIEDIVQFENNYLANISFMYNYEGAEDGGYYWVDSYDNSTVEFIPPEPTREGYRFSGWYKEPECLNIWEFAMDKTGNELPIVISYDPFKIYAQYNEIDGIRLYAKWIKQ